ncbi:MAG: hypothetical protein AB8G99_04185 [Planctomycetaceae bacterium]
MFRARFTFLVCTVLLAPGTLCAQFDVPPSPTTQQIQSAVSAIAPPSQGAAVATGGQSVTVNTGRSCPTMWEFLGVDKAAQGMRSAFGVARRIPIIQNFGNTVVHPVARAAQIMPAPPGGALAAETSAPAGPSAGAGPAPGGTPAAGPPNAPAPGMPQLPGAPALKPPAPGPAALLAKIKAAKAANKTQVAAIKQLQRIDPREYPEIVASLLGKLDDPSEEVRYQALLALRNVARPKHCTRARAEECACEVCQESWMRQSILSQPMVIDRLTDLLLRGSIHSPERIAGANVSGAPKEYSNRIRRLAVEMLEGSLRKPQTNGIRRAVPDPKYLGERKQELPPDPIAKRRPVPQSVPARPVSNRRVAPAKPRFKRTELPNEDFIRYVALAEQILSKPAYAEHVSTEPHRSIRKAANLYLRAGDTDSRDLDREVVSLCYSAIRTCRAGSKASGELQLAFILLTNARLRLAIDGQEEHVAALTVDADAFRKWNPDSIAAREGALSVVRYARAVAEQYGSQDNRYIKQLAQQATHFAKTYADDTEYIVPQLVAAAELCELNGLESENQSCIRALQRFADDALANKALRAHRSRNPAPEVKQADSQETSQGSTVVQAAGLREPGHLRQVAFEQFEPLPPAEHAAPTYIDNVVAPDIHEGYTNDDRYAFERTGPSMHSFIAAMKALDASHQFEEVEGDCCLGEGFRNIATARSEYSLFALEAARPANVFRVRFDSAKEFSSPDRAEFFWAAIGRGGPSQPERYVDFQELRIYSEKSIGSSSAFVEIPFRMLDPVVNSNTTGLGDINMGAKTILLEDDGYTVSTVFRSYFNSGLDRRGLGRGHFVLEPGVLANYKLGCDTWLHGEVKFLMPLGANKDTAGEALTFGAGFNHVLFAEPYHSGGAWNLGVIASLEFQAISLLDGRGTLPSGATRPTDETNLYLFPGIRFMLGEKYDLGFSAAIPISEVQLYDRLFRTELRVSF